MIEVQVLGEHSSTLYIFPDNLNGGVRMFGMFCIFRVQNVFAVLGWLKA